MASSSYALLLICFITFTLAVDAADPQVGGNCTTSADCGNVALQCNSNKCGCTSKYKEENKTCKGLAGTSCDKDEQCVQNSKCTEYPSKEKKCTCSDQYDIDKDQTCSKVLHSFCAASNDCGSEAQICNNHTCVCAGGYNVAADGETCSYIYGNNCTADKDCGTSAMKCGSKNTCECNIGYSMQNNICKYNYGMSCTGDTCGSPTMFCNGSMCICLNGTHSFENGICKASLGAICVGGDCMSNFATCTGEKSNKTCVCNKDYENYESKCLAPPNKPCSINEGCKDKHSKCTEGDQVFSCTCNSGYEFNKESMKCSGSIISGSVIAAAFALIMRLV